MRKNNILEGQFGTKKGGRKVDVSEGITPTLGSRSNPPADQRLKAEFEDPDLRMPIVIEMGTILSIDPDTKKIVPCNGGNNVTVTYDRLDVQDQVKDKTSKLVEEGATETFKANAPIAWTLWDIPQNPLCKGDGNWIPDLQAINPDIYTRRFIVVPVMYKTEGSKYDFKEGDLVMADGNPDTTENPIAKVGRPIVAKTDPSIAEAVDSKQIAGRVLFVEPLTRHYRGGLDKVNGDNIDVQSSSTEGLERFFYENFNKGGKEYKKAMVYIKANV